MEYLWLKALHVISVIAWMVAMLYLPRLFVYHAGAGAGSAQSETFKIMEYRLMRYIMTPAMILVWLTGIVLMISSGAFHQGWFHAKLTLVLVMSGLHGYLAVCARHFREDRNTHSVIFYRILNEVPTFLMIGIIILVIVKPF